MARDRLRLTLEEIQQKVRAGEYQLHEFPLGCVVTEIRQFPLERILIVHALAGERFGEWKEEVVNHLRAFASEHECAAIEAVCRLGLEPLLKPLGWKRTQVVLRTEINGRGQ